MSRNAYLIGRKFYIISFFLLIAVVYTLRLAYIQLWDDSYDLAAKNNALRRMVEYPFRGYIIDRNGKPIVQNEPSFDLMVTPKEIQNCDTLALCKLLEITKTEFLKRIKKAIQAPNSPIKPSTFEKQMSFTNYARISESLFKFKGFYFQKRSLRKYFKPVAAHVLGYVGEVSKEKALADPYYKEGDYIGISGIERSYEAELRGKKGIQYLVTDVHNKIIGPYRNGTWDTLAVPGNNLYASLDIDLQEYGEQLLRGKTGAIVAIEPETGEILALISSPNYDPNSLIGGKQRNQTFARLNKDSTLPLLNRALQGAYPPGSTFKLLGSLIAQHDGLINRTTVFPCRGGYPPLNGKPKCHAHGVVNLPGSVAQSCNSYYAYVFKTIVDQNRFKSVYDGYNHWRDMVMSFGPGHHLGTDLPYDKPGNVPKAEYYDKIFGKGAWRPNTVVSLGIGQAELLLVPLQMANIISIIANKGYYFTPHVIKGIGTKHAIDKKFKTQHWAAVTDTNYYNMVIDGMQQCFENGTAAAEKISGIIACGKTGTAENPHGKDHSVFVGFAPRHHPKIVLACIVENAGWGGTWAAPIVSLMMERYLTGKVVRLDKEKRIMETAIKVPVKSIRKKRSA